MSELKITDTVKAEVKAEVKPVSAAVDKPFEVREKNPSDWELAAPEEGFIKARCNATGRVFVGTMEAFNALLRG